MAKKKTKSGELDRTPELLRDLIIIQLGLAGVGQKEIRSIVGGDMNQIKGKATRGILTPKMGKMVIRYNAYSQKMPKYLLCSTVTKLLLVYCN